jgi:hypothetical protein
MRFARAPRLAAVLALGLVLPWQAGCAAQYGAETAAQHRAQAWECGKGGYGVALCPPARRKAPVPSAAPAPPAEAGDECLKSGYGIPLCPSFGRRAAIPPSEVQYRGFTGDLHLMQRRLDDTRSPQRTCRAPHCGQKAR